MLTDNDFTHVISGYSTAFSIQNAFKIPSANLVKCGDVLSVGQQNNSDSYQQWAKAREPALAATWNVEADELFGGDARFELFHNVALLDSNMPVLIWLDCTVDSQLMASFLCHLFISGSWDISRLHVLAYELVGELYFGILPVLNEKELHERRPALRRLLPGEVRTYAQIWSAFTGSDLTRMLQVCFDRKISTLSMNALSYLSRRLPSRFNGLNEIEHELLKHAVNRAPSAARAVGDAMGYDETPDMVGDLYLSARFQRFGSHLLKHPLIEIDRASGPIRECHFKVLPLANQILSGAVNMIEINGLDDWIGGVHLTPHNLAYREDLANIV